MNTVNIAHTKNDTGHRQALEEHLRNVADAAMTYCTSFGGAAVARYAGLLHDIGKYDPAFQSYLLQAEQNPNKHSKGPDHKGAGTVLAEAFEQKGSLACSISGHHGGLPSAADVHTRINALRRQKNIQEAIAFAKKAFPELQTTPGKILPGYIRSAWDLEFFTRMIFSALVDADFLDTEQHFNGGKQQERGHYLPLPDLWHRFEIAYQERFPYGIEAGCGLKQPSHLNTIRTEVYQHCLSAARLPPGIFRLTVPTGGGKTLASLAFALQHALLHDRKRVIYAIPYTSIIDQTATVFRELLGDDQTFIEHHSNISVKESVLPTLTEIRRRLAAENWDASLIVTTTVQLFESLMGQSTSTCRKLHNIAQSVLILDEAQMLPVYYLTPILDILRQLASYYGVTIVLCTATQPNFESRQGFEGLPNIHEIIPEPKNYFEQLKRVEYQLPAPGETWAWEAIADRVQNEQQILVIVNTRRDASDLLELLKSNDDPALFHLSTRLCGAHRKIVLEEIHRRLQTGEPCRLIATQVIEAGVDVDFPLVMRAIGPMDSIVQAAGRANREGKMPQPGIVIVFVPEQGHKPKGSYLLATDITERLLKNTEADLHNPALYQQYFREYYDYPHCDYHGIQELRRSLDYPNVAHTFRMIEDESVSVIVAYEPAKDFVINALDRLRRFKQIRREDFRALQPYTVHLLTHEFKKAQQNQQVAEVIPGIWEWCGDYDSGKNGKGIVLTSFVQTDRYIW